MIVHEKRAVEQFTAEVEWATMKLASKVGFPRGSIFTLNLFDHPGEGDLVDLQFRMTKAGEEERWGQTLVRARADMVGVNVR